MSAIFDDMMTGLDEVEAFLAGEKAGYKVSLPPEIDVKSIRQRLDMTQARFAEVFGFSLDAVKHWEGGRRTPEAAARAFLKVIAENPGAVLTVLHPPTAPAAKGRKRPQVARPSRKRPRRTSPAEGHRSAPGGNGAVRDQSAAVRNHGSRGRVHARVSNRG
jgi:putative transcriptional regulator